MPRRSALSESMTRFNIYLTNSSEAAEDSWRSELGTTAKDAGLAGMVAVRLGLGGVKEVEEAQAPHASGSGSPVP